ncbi:hypothetical protein IPJ72_00395 [Candidatus Peregrinibacteria bacterium]|nr:MAG: hypothetical protein IPJ72_00395 [Candidatus Peregrinibacteria bacterium]
MKEAEEVLELDRADVKELNNNDDLFAAPQAYQLLINQTVDRSFFEQLKQLFEKHPGEDSVELVIGEKIVPVPMKVEYDEKLKKSIDHLLNQ